MSNITNRQIAEKTIEYNLDYLFRFAFFRLGDHAMAEDAVHDAVLKFLSNNNTVHSPDAYRLYLFRILYNLCNDITRRGTKHTVSIEAVEIQEPTEDESLDIAEADRINAILDKIPPKESEIIRLYIVDELSYAEISRITDIPPSTIKSRFKAGIEKMRKIYFSK